MVVAVVYCSRENQMHTANKIDVLLIYTGLAEGDLNLFRVLAVLIILLCIFFLVPQVIPIWIFHSRHTMTAVTFAFIRFLSIVLTIIFVSGFANDCWCAPPWQWQIGALAVFLAYILFILQLGGMPYFGVYIHMLVNIVITFVELVFLPFFLILSFAIPFYMLFVRERGAMQVGLDEMSFGSLWLKILFPNRLNRSQTLQGLFSR